MTFPRFRSGSADDRGRVLRFPPASEEALPPSRWAWLRGMGPGIVTGAADVDPSLVVTATVAGAAFHYALLWVVVLCIPFLYSVFGVAARIGRETRRGLVDLLRVNYGRRLALFCALLVILINMGMIVADLMAVTDALSIILGQERTFFTAVVAFTVWYVLILSNYRRVTHALLWLSLPLFIYVAAAIFAVPSWPAVAQGMFVPHIARSVDYLSMVIGLFGSLLTPYIIVWQTSSRREQTAPATGVSLDSHAGTVVTTVLSAAVIVAAGTVLHLDKPLTMTTRQAAAALAPVVGSFGPIVFAIGILGAGMVALPVLVASMCYSVSEAMGWRSGLSEQPWEAKTFYALISLALFVGAICNFININPIKALYWSQVLAGILAVPILVFILVLANDRRIMQTTNTRAQNFWVGAAAGALVAAIGLLVFWRL